MSVPIKGIKHSWLLMRVRRLYHDEEDEEEDEVIVNPAGRVKMRMKMDVVT